MTPVQLTPAQRDALIVLSDGERHGMSKRASAEGGRVNIRAGNALAEHGLALVHMDFSPHHSVFANYDEIEITDEGRQLLRDLGMPDAAPFDPERFDTIAEQQEWFENLARTITWDFDGTIHPYSQGWIGATPDDEPPIDGVRELIEKFDEQGFRQVVFSTRCERTEGRDGVIAWLEKYELDTFFAEITHTKPPAIAYIDDRAVPYLGNWEDVEIRVKGLAAGRPHGAAPR